MGPESRTLALLTDVHANLPALEAVIAAARDRGVEEFWDAGDILGYGAFPGPCLDLLRETCCCHVLGNYDAKVLMTPDKLREWRRKKHPTKVQAFAWAHDQLGRKQRRWLAGLPEQHIQETGGLTLVLRHALAQSSTEVEDRATRSHLLEQLEEEFRDLPRPLVIVGGHVHHPCAAEISGAGLRLVLAGSVGRPIDGDPRAHLTLLHLRGDQVQVENLRIPYDVGRAAEEIRRQGQPEVFALMVENGMDMKQAEALLPGN